MIHANNYEKLFKFVKVTATDTETQSSYFFLYRVATPYSFFPYQMLWQYFDGTP